MSILSYMLGPILYNLLECTANLRNFWEIQNSKNLSIARIFEITTTVEKIIL